jgi:hypothetical protein
MNTKQSIKRDNDDPWNVRRGGGRFIYKGNVLNIIIFCQPKLLKKGYKYDYYI